MKLNRSRLFLILLLAFFLTSVAVSLTFNPRTRWFPAGCAAIGAALCVSLLVQRGEPSNCGPGSGAWKAALPPLIVAGLGAIGGMLVAAAVVHAVYALFYPEARSWRRVLAAALASTVLVYALFGVLLEVPLLTIVR